MEPLNQQPHPPYVAGPGEPTTRWSPPTPPRPPIGTAPRTARRRRRAATLVAGAAAIALAAGAGGGWIGAAGPVLGELRPKGNGRQLAVPGAATD